MPTSNPPDLERQLAEIPLEELVKLGERAKRLIERGAPKESHLDAADEEE